MYLLIITDHVNKETEHRLFKSQFNAQKVNESDYSSRYTNGRFTTEIVQLEIEDE